MAHKIRACSAPRGFQKLPFDSRPPGVLKGISTEQRTFSMRHPMRDGVGHRPASASARIATLLACLSSTRVFVRTIERRTRRGFFSTACWPRSSLDSWAQRFPKPNASAGNNLSSTGRPPVRWAFRWRRSAPRRAAIEQWTTIIRAQMQEQGVADPVEILPELLARVREQAIGEARAAAKIAAREEVRKLFRKVLT